MNDDDKDKDDTTELKNLDLNDQRNISVNDTGICLMQTDRNLAGLNTKMFMLSAIIIYLRIFGLKKKL